MKKSLFIAIFTAVFVVAAIIPNTAIPSVAHAENTSAETFKSYKTDDIYAFLSEFLSACPNRSGASDEKKAAEWLSEKFFELTGHTPTISALSEDNSSSYAYNVEMRLQGANSDRQIIVGAHFDSVGEGANDNASGIAAMYFLMKNLFESSSMILPFDVVFVAFGGEEQGLLGSNYYVEHMSSEERAKTMVMFNLDSIGGGDNLYVFCENKRTDLANLILDNHCGSPLLEKPYAVGTYPMDNFGYGYYEFIQGADHTPFRLASIPTVCFFAGNFVGWNYVESSDSSKNVMNTADDKLSTMNEFWGEEFVNKIDTVVLTLTATIASAEFFAVAENARNQLVNNDVVYNILWPTLIVVALLCLCALFAWLHFRKLKKDEVLDTAEAKDHAASIFTKPDVDDIFDFGSKK